MVLSVDRVGIKQTAKAFRTSRNTVRKWWRRFNVEGYRGLQARSRRPLRSPLATPPEEREHLVALKSKYKRLGADQIRIIEGLDLSARTIRKIWRQEGVSSRKRRRKSRTKQNLREVKRQWENMIRRESEGLDTATYCLISLLDYFGTP